MDIVRKRRFGQNYAFVVVGVVFLALLSAAGMRSAPGVLLQPLEQVFGWSRSVTSFSAGLGIFLYGMVDLCGVLWPRLDRDGTADFTANH
jgi:hypothetical protein